MTVRFDVVGQLPPDVVEEARAFGARRREESRAAALTVSNHAGGASGSSDEVGAVGEYIAAAVFDLPAPRCGSFKSEPDVGPLEIQTVQRGTAWREARTSLIIRPSDLKQGCAERPYVLVVLHPKAAFTLPGWLYAEEAQDMVELSCPGGEGKPAWFVPAEQLRPLDASFWRLLADWRAAA